MAFGFQEKKLAPRHQPQPIWKTVADFQADPRAPRVQFDGRAQRGSDRRSAAPAALFADLVCARSTHNVPLERPSRRGKDRGAHD
jgi:hypothetical protein